MGLLSTLLETGNVILLAVHRHSAGLTQRVDPNLDTTFEVDKQTALWSQCTCPLLRHTPLSAVNGGKPTAHLWFCNALWVAGVYLTTTDSLLSLQDHTLRYALWLRFDRAQYRRFSSYDGFIELLHLG